MTWRERFAAIASISNYLVVSSFVVLAILLLRSGGLTLPNVLIGGGLIVVANFVFVVSVFFFPDLIGTGRITRPLTITLPLVFCGWGVAVACLGWRTGSPLEPTLEPIRKFAALFKPEDMIWFLIAQSAALLWGSRSQEAVPPPSEADSA